MKTYIILFLALTGCAGNLRAENTRLNSEVAYYRTQADWEHNQRINAEQANSWVRQASDQKDALIQRVSAENAQLKSIIENVMKGAIKSLTPPVIQGEGPGQKL